MQLLGEHCLTDKPEQLKFHMEITFLKEMQFSLEQVMTQELRWPDVYCCFSEITKS